MAGSRVGSSQHSAEKRTLLFLALCIKTVAPFCPVPAGTYAWFSPTVLHSGVYASRGSVSHFASRGLACRQLSLASDRLTTIPCQRASVVTPLDAGFNDRSDIGGADRDSEGAGNGADRRAIFDLAARERDDSTVTLQRLSAELQEEQSSIEAREDLRSGGRKRPLFRQRQARVSAMPEYGQVRVIEPTRQHTATIIWLHDAPPGSKSSPKRWEKRLRAMDLGWCRIVIPTGFHVPRPRSLLDKLVRRGEQRQWFEESSDYGLATSLQYMQTLVGREAQSGIAPDRIMIGGVGQGADIAVLAGLLLNARLGGVISLGAHLPETIALLPSSESVSTPFLCWISPQDLDAAEAGSTLLSLAGPARRIECVPEEGNWLTDSVDYLRRRWRIWGSACRAEVEDFIWRTIPEDADSIPAVDLMAAPRKRAEEAGRPERFLPLPMLTQTRRIEAMTLRELQACMQLHAVRYDDVTSEAEARFRLRSAALLISNSQRRSPSSRRASGPGGGARDGRREGGEEAASAEEMADRVWKAGQEAVDLGGAAFTSEEARREIFERAWGAGRNAASFAQEAVSSEEARQQAVSSLRDTAENAAFYAQETLSDPSAAQEMARAAWRAGRAAASSVADVASDIVDDLASPPPPGAGAVWQEPDGFVRGERQGRGAGSGQEEARKGVQGGQMQTKVDIVKM